LKVGICAWNLKQQLLESILTAGELGADCVQLMAAGGHFPWPPDRHTLARVTAAAEEAGVEIASFAGGFGNIAQDGTLEERLEWATSVLALAGDMGVGIVTSHVGTIADNLDSPAGAVMLSQLERLGAEAERRAIKMGIETGPESPQTMAAALERLSIPALGVNYDPANLLMAGLDWLGGINVLGRWIVHVHAKDARLRADGKPQQTPFGHGNVDVRAFISELRHVGFDGYVTLERESGEERLRDMRIGLAVLRRCT
jgi:L-ribulose-5-phosphate 3-epimerase